MDLAAAAIRSGASTEQLLAHVLDALDVAAVLLDRRDAAYPIVYADSAFERLTGFGPAEVIGRDLSFLEGDETELLPREVMRGTIERGGRVTVTLAHFRSDGTKFWNEIQLVPLGEGEPPTLYMALMRDVTERVDAELGLGHAEILRTTAFNSMHEGILVLGTNGMAADANATALRILGTTREDLNRADWWARLQLRHPDGRPLEPADSPGLKAFQQRRRISDARMLVRRGDGEDRLMSFSYEPVADSDTGPQALVVSIQDVTERERSEVDLEQFARLVEVSEDFIALADLDGQITHVNPAGGRLVGLARTGTVGLPHLRELLTEKGWVAWADTELPAVLETGSWRGESALRHLQSGATIPVRSSTYLVRHPDTGEAVAIATIRRDISEELRYTNDLIRSRARYEAQFRSLPLPTYVWQRQGDDFVLIEWNEAAVEATAGTVAQLHGARASEIYTDEPELLLAFERCWSTHSKITREQPYRMRITGERKHLIVTYAWVPPDLVLVHTLDITARVISEQRLQEMAEHDDLTGLHNRRHFEQRLGDVLGRRAVSVLLVDIDHFKFINDSFGHDAGDELLREVASVMSCRLRDGDVLARFGGDEFAILLDGCEEEQARAVANHVLGAIRSSLSGASVTASCGLATLLPKETIAVSDALVAADIALYEAKQRGRDRVEVFSGQAGQSLTWVQQIREAIAGDRLLLYAQPVIDVQRGGEPIGYELLIRMCDEHGQIIPPTSFLPTAEQFGLMRDIDRWVIEHGIAFQARSGTHVSLNLSARSLGDPELPDRIRETIERAGAAPGNLTFEFTETAAISSIDEAKTLAEALGKLGCHVALDDFGTGFGTFILLKHLPVDALKIDKEFVRRLSCAPADQTIVRLIVQIAHDAGMMTVAEGVEDAGALALLREYGVDFAQGFHIAEPAPLPE